MPFTIISTENGFEIRFHFSKSTALVTIEIGDDEYSRILHVESRTDGYHWLNIWMAAAPGSLKLDERDEREVEIINRASMESLGFRYELEDKETCSLTIKINDDMETCVKRFAEFMEPRFALREKFFPDDYFPPS